MGGPLSLSPLPGLNRHPLPAPCHPHVQATLTLGGAVSCRWPRRASLCWRVLVFMPRLPPHSALPSISSSHINASLVHVPEIDLSFSLELCYRFICPAGPYLFPPCTINIYVSACPPPYYTGTLCGTEWSCTSSSSSQFKMSSWTHTVHADGTRAKKTLSSRTFVVAGNK